MQLSPLNRNCNFSFVRSPESTLFVNDLPGLLDALGYESRFECSQGGFLRWIRVNDPSAGSPTETLLRLLLPLNDQV